MRWLPIPIALAREPAIANLSLQGRLVHVALRVAHAEQGVAGVIPRQYATQVGLSLVAPALLVGVDIAAGLGELEGAGLTGPHPDGLALRDFDPETELMKCTRCKRRNPVPRASRCPRCCDEKPDGPRTPDGVRGANGQHLRSGAAERAQNSRRNGADVESATLPCPALPEPTRPCPAEPGAQGGGQGAAADEGQGGQGTDADGEQLGRLLIAETRILDRAPNREPVLLGCGVQAAAKGLTEEKLRRLIALSNGKDRPSGWLRWVLERDRWDAELALAAGAQA